MKLNQQRTSTDGKLSTVLLLVTVIWRTILENVNSIGHIKLTKMHVLLLENFFENVFKSSVVFLHDCVLGAHVERPLLLQSNLHAAVCEVSYGLGRKFKY